MISIVRAQVAHTNTHELDAHMNFMIHGTYIMRATICSRELLQLLDSWRHMMILKTSIPHGVLISMTDCPLSL